VQPTLPVDQRPFAVTPGKKILVVEPDEGNALRLEHDLSPMGCRCRRVTDGEEALLELQDGDYDLVILSVNLPGSSGFEICRRLRMSPELPPTPVILLGARTNGRDVVRGFEEGADDFVGRPYDADEFLARVKALLVRSERHIGLNPLTALPGNLVIGAEIDRRIGEGGPFAVYYLDIDNFKAYNDGYGYDAGDRAIRVLARILVGLRARLGLSGPFVGHIGGDDFVLIADPIRKEEICVEIIRAFDAEVVKLYSETDRARGFTIVENRRGKRDRVPLMRISIGVVTNEHRPLTDAREVAQIASETKRKAKESRGVSSYYIDQRRG
jgi:diguanylate cyclase (GGDEF)-like protein